MNPTVVPDLSKQLRTLRNNQKTKNGDKEISRKIENIFFFRRCFVDFSSMFVDFSQMFVDSPQCFPPNKIKKAAGSGGIHFHQVSSKSEHLGTSYEQKPPAASEKFAASEKSSGFIGRPASRREAEQAPPQESARLPSSGQ